VAVYIYLASAIERSVFQQVIELWQRNMLDIFSQPLALDTQFDLTIGLITVPAEFGVQETIFPLQQDDKLLDCWDRQFVIRVADTVGSCSSSTNPGKQHHNRSSERADGALVRYLQLANNVRKSTCCWD
jgi:hypothetical protein